MSGPLVRIKIEDRTGGKIRHVKSLTVYMDPEDVCACVLRAIPRMFQRQAKPKPRKGREVVIGSAEPGKDGSRD